MQLQDSLAQLKMAAQIARLAHTIQKDNFVILILIFSITEEAHFNSLGIIIMLISLRNSMEMTDLCRTQRF